MRKCVYTVITGNYDTLISPKVVSSEFDYICFTDNPELKSDVWQIRLVDPADDPVKQQRKIKIRSDLYLSEYNITIYVDGNQIILGDIRGLLDFYSGGFATRRHPLRKDIWQESERIIDLKKAHQVDVDAQISHYRAMETQITGLWATGFIIRDNSASTRKLCAKWWEHVEKYTHRDQLALPVASHLTGIPVSPIGNTLSERFFRIVPHSVSRIFGVKIMYSNPFAVDKNIGRAYNEFCNIVPDDHWICLQDGDMMYLHNEWGKQIENIITMHGRNYDLFGCVTNRIGGDSRQHPFPELFDDPDYTHHKAKAIELFDTKYSTVTPTDLPVAGLLMVFHKSTWKKHPFKEKTHHFDTDFGFDILNSGGKIGIMQGLYVFHDYRFGRNNPTKYVKHLQV